MKGIINSSGRTVQVEECLAPRDREVRSEAKKLGLFSYTRKQDVFVFNQNLPNSDSVQVKSKYELEDFVANHEPRNVLAEPMPRNDVSTSQVMDTPQQMPMLTRKPTTLVTQRVKRKRLQLSPAQEDDESSSLADNIAQTLIPALMKALKDVSRTHSNSNAEALASPGKQQASKVQCKDPVSDNYTFPQEVQVDQT